MASHRVSIVLAHTVALLLLAHSGSAIASENVPQPPQLLRMNLTRTSPTSFDPLQAAIQLGIKYGTSSGSPGSSGSSTSIASLAKQLEFDYLNDTVLSDGSSQGVYSFLNNAEQPVQLHSKSFSPLSYLKLTRYSHPISLCPDRLR